MLSPTVTSMLEGGIVITVLSVETEKKKKKKTQHVNMLIKKVDLE